MKINLFPYSRWVCNTVTEFFLRFSFLNLKPYDWWENKLNKSKQYFQLEPRQRRPTQRFNKISTLHCVKMKHVYLKMGDLLFLQITFTMFTGFYSSFWVSGIMVNLLFWGHVTLTDHVTSISKFSKVLIL